jgi:GTP-binding protein YchF
LSLGEKMKLGMVGLPNVGKSTLFNALTDQKSAQSANYPFCTIEKNIGIVSVHDERLDKLAEIYEPDKFTPATLEFADIAGLVRGASKGEGLGNKFLADIRTVDAIIHVVRCFESGDIVHVDGGVNPERDVETINLELIFSDIEILERRIDKTKKALKGDKELAVQLDFFEKLKTHLENGNPARSYPMTEQEAEYLSDVPLLSAKLVIYAANLSENDFTSGLQNQKHFKTLQGIAEREKASVIPVCAKLEESIAGADDEEKAFFLDELGIDGTGLARIIKESYSQLGLISYLTAGKQEVRAWTIKKGTTAPKAAGKIHTDFERGFIRAEIIAYDDFISAGGNMTSAKEKGLVRIEGKDYVMKDGDIVLFRFNV